MLKNGGKTGRPEFPGDRNFPGKKKNPFLFGVLDFLDILKKKSLNEKYVSRNWPSSKMKIFTLPVLPPFFSMRSKTVFFKIAQKFKFEKIAKNLK